MCHLRACSTFQDGLTVICPLSKGQSKFDRFLHTDAKIEMRMSHCDETTMTMSTVSSCVQWQHNYIKVRRPPDMSLISAPHSS